MEIRPLGDTALTIALGEKIDESTHRRVQGALAALEKAQLPAVVELVPAFTTVTVFYDPAAAVAAGAPVDDIAGWMTTQLTTHVKSAAKATKAAGRTVEIPVCYGGEFGPDIGRVAARAKLSEEEVVRRHTTPEYLVYLVGFAPGFPYLGGLPRELATPRLASPRTLVAAGSVGIAGEQTGIYPLETPGGWNLIGRTPQRLFEPEKDPPVFLRAGDRLKFRAITREEFELL